MLMMLLGALLSILIPTVIYVLVLKGKEHTKVSKYVTTFIWGATLCTIIILLLEAIIDVVCLGHLLSDTTPESLSNAIWLSLPRTAVPEEAIKLLFAYLILRKCKDLGPREIILLAGLVGVGYGFSEKLAYMSGGAILLNAVAPGHMLFQWAMGYFLVKAFRDEDGQKAKWFALAYVVPMLMHFVWNFFLNLSGLGMEMGGAVQTVAVLCLPVFLIVVIVLVVIFARRIRKMD